MAETESPDDVKHEYGQEEEAATSVILNDDHVTNQERQEEEAGSAQLGMMMLCFHLISNET